MSSDYILEERQVLEAARAFLRSLIDVRHLLVAISGGSDSTGLLLAFHSVLQEREFSQFSLKACTVDHQLRPESGDEALEVSRLCARLNIAHVIKTWQGAKPKSGISKAARLARYDLLLEAAQALSADVLLLGHNLGDQQETIAMRKARSEDESSLGLAGMADAVLVKRQIWACRPFLTLSREVIRSFLKSQDQVWIDDPSNESRAYERVRIRQELALQEIASNEIDWDQGQGARRQLLSAKAAQWFKEFAMIDCNGLVTVRRQGFNAALDEMRYALGYLGAIVGGREFPVPKAQLDAVLRLIFTGEKTRLTAQRVVFDLRKDHVFLYREARNLPKSAPATDVPVLWDNRFWLMPQKANVKEPALILNDRLPHSVQTWAFERSANALAVEFSSRIEGYLAPFDHFLPRFDFAFASAVNDAFEREPLRPLPFAA